MTKTVNRDSEGARATTFAAQPLNLRNKADSKYLDVVITHSRRTGEPNWRWWDRLGTVRYPLKRAAKIAGFAQLRAVLLDSEGRVVGDHPKTLPHDIVGSIYSMVGGVRGLIERFFLLQKVPAEAHLIRVKEKGQFVGYEFLSSSELETGHTPLTVESPNRGMRWVTLPNISADSVTGEDQPMLVRRVAQEDYLGRVWTPSPRWINLPESPLEALNNECDLLDTITTALRAMSKSRVAMSGILFIPKSISSMQGPDGPVTGDKILEYFKKILTSNLESFDDLDVARVAPVLLRGEDDAGDKIRHITLDREILETDLTLMVHLARAILFALDIIVPSTTGEGANHWQAWENAADEVRLAVMPDLDALDWTLTRLILHPQLSEAGWSDEDILTSGITHSLDRAQVRINQAEDVRQGNDRGAVNLETMRRVFGLDDNAALSPEEQVQWAGRITRNPYLMLWGTDHFDDIDWEVVKSMGASTGRKPDSGGDEPPEGPGEGDPGSPSEEDRETDTPRDERPA